MNRKLRSITIKGEEDKTKPYDNPEAKEMSERIIYFRERLVLHVGDLINISGEGIQKPEYEKIESMELDEALDCILIRTKNRNEMPILYGLSDPMLLEYEIV